MFFSQLIGLRFDVHALSNLPIGRGDTITGFKPRLIGGHDMHHRVINRQQDPTLQPLALR